MSPPLPLAKLMPPLSNAGPNNSPAATNPGPIASIHLPSFNFEAALNAASAAIDFNGSLVDPAVNKLPVYFLISGSLIFTLCFFVNLLSFCF